jgi:hypothetical protein
MVSREDSLYAHGIQISWCPGAAEFRCEVVQAFSENPCLIFSFVVRNERVFSARLLDAVTQIGAIRQTFRGVIFWGSLAST